MTARERNLVITGFMGAGKSCVARRVAEMLSKPLVAMDEVIAQRAGKSIPDLFATDGEEAFRRAERELCLELGTREGLVIDTGGGALVDPRNRDALAQNGCLVALDCTEDELLRRLRGDRQRPMLWGDDPVARLRELLAERRAAYAEVPHHVDNSDRPLEAVAQEVIALWRAEPFVRWARTPTGSYQIQLVPGGLSHIGRLLRARGIEGVAAVVSDEHVWPRYGTQVMDALAEAGLAASHVVLPAGEEHKRLETVRDLYDRFVEMGLDRSGAVVALGGGVVTDMVGFAAATFMRGVPLVQASTTLLGMVDASVGGKVAVDHPQGKNLVGAFVQPLLVMLDPATLATLPDLERRAGLAEVIKAGIIADAELFEAYEAGEPERGLRWAIERALDVKLTVVEEDPYERGRRMVLNLGHTFAHAFEVLTLYQLHHGLAVSVGMAAAAELAQITGACSDATRNRILSTLIRHHLPTTFDSHPPEAVLAAMRHDKKRSAGKLRLVLPRDIGDAIIVTDVPTEQIVAALERIHS